MVQVGKSIVLIHGFFWSAYVEDFLEELRRVRGKVEDQGLHHAFNEVCDRLDVLVSKLKESEARM